MSGSLFETSGDVLEGIFPPGIPVVLPHVCNNQGAFGAGVARSISKKYPSVVGQYKRFLRRFTVSLRDPGLALGMTKFSVVEKTEARHILIANMIAQDGLPSPSNTKPLSIPALTRCMADVVYTCDRHFGFCMYDIHCPMFGSGFGGADWETDILPRICSLWLASGVNVTVYNL